MTFWEQIEDPCLLAGPLSCPCYWKQCREHTARKPIKVSLVSLVATFSYTFIYWWMPREQVHHSFPLSIRQTEGGHLNRWIQEAVLRVGCLAWLRSPHQSSSHHRWFGSSCWGCFGIHYSSWSLSLTDKLSVGSMQGGGSHSTSW